MTAEQLLGRMTALVEITEKHLEDIQNRQADFGDLALRFQQASREIGEFRGLVGDLEELVRRNQRTDWMTSRELAEEMHVTPKSIRNWYEWGLIPGYKLSPGPRGRIRFDRREVCEAIRNEGMDGGEKKDR